MNGDEQEPKAIRLQFELARADNPRLYDELMRFPQGVKRVNRLRLLAYEGLLGHGRGVAASPAPAPATVSERVVAPKAAAVSNTVFEPSVAD